MGTDDTPALVEEALGFDPTKAPFTEGGIGNALCAVAEAYLDEYVYGGEECADHEPTEFERELLTDFWNGLVSDENFFGYIRRAVDALAKSAPAGSEEDIEAWARIIDPYAFRENARNDSHDEQYRKKAIAKARQIAALCQEKTGSSGDKSAMQGTTALHPEGGRVAGGGG